MHLLRMPLQKRREALAARDQKRGVKATDELRAVMRSIHECKKNKTVA